ncbi:MAG: hypothetical protein ACYC0Z_05570 [Acidobacteriaceae bacterium]
MGHWYRRPKSLNLKCLLRDSGCEFVFDASQTSADELLELQASFARVYGSQRLLRNLSSTPSAKRILIIAEDENGLAPSTRLHEGWRGVVVLPGDARQRREALTLFFMQQLRYKISHPYWASQYRGEIPPFLLDLTKAPATITPAELFVQHRENEK